MLIDEPLGFDGCYLGKRRLLEGGSKTARFLDLNLILEERASARVSKDGPRASWFETPAAAGSSP
jgi:hypothetical protein